MIKLLYQVIPTDRYGTLSYSFLTYDTDESLERLRENNPVEEYRFVKGLPND